MANREKHCVEAVAVVARLIEIDRELARLRRAHELPASREAAAPEVLRGDIAQTRELIDSIDRKWTYTTGVISFAREDAPSEDQQWAVMDDFERLAFAGLDPEQYDITWVRHRHTKGGRVELHFLVPRMELSTGRVLNIAPPGWETTFAPLRDAWTTPSRSGKSTRTPWRSWNACWRCSSALRSKGQEWTCQHSERPQDGQRPRARARHGERRRTDGERGLRLQRPGGQRRPHGGRRRGRGQQDR